MSIDYEISIYIEKDDRYVKLAQFFADADITRKRIEGSESNGLLGGNMSITAAVHGVKEIFAENRIPEFGTIVIFDNRCHQITLRNCVIQQMHHNAYIYSESIKEVVK